MKTTPTNNRPALGLLVLIAAAACLASILSLAASTDATLHPEFWLTPDQHQTQDAELPTLIVFSADWCGPCTTFKRRALTRPEVQQAMTGRLNAIHADLTAPDSSARAAEALANQYDITEIPTTLLIGPDGTVIRRLTGGLDAPRFLQWLEEALATPDNSR
ncbi:MAG: thioredoxin fold domain-containing protein [Phycisphaeraceae bacterium]